MRLEKSKKQNLINTIKEKLSQFTEINKIVLFGSFIDSDNPHDIDMAIFQDTDENFLTLSLKYRKVLRELSKTIPLDIVPIKKNSVGVFLEEINKGQVVYER